MYAKIAISCIAAAIIIFILVIISPDTQSLNRGWTAFFVGMGADIILLIVAIVFTILSVVNERTVLSWVCAAILIIAILFTTAVLIFNSSYGDGYRERKAQKEKEWAAANPEINEHTMLIHIARGNNEPIQRHLLRHGVETCDRMGNTPMMIAALSGNVDLLQWLIEYKARVNAQNILGVTALHMACGNMTFTVYLIKHKAASSNDGVNSGLYGFKILLLVCMAIILLLGALLFVETAVLFFKGSHHNAWKNLALILFFASWYIFLMTLG